MRSKMWDSGRNERHSSPSMNRNSDTQVVTLDAMLPCVSMTPFGSPVVPEV